MIGDAYFQLRAQIGTALFSLLRLATETGASETTLTALRAAQADLRESFLFLALGSMNSEKSTLLNVLFEREFCGVVEPGTAGKAAVFLHGEEARDTVLSTDVVECRRPHIFLRDFTVVDAPGGEAIGRPTLEELAPYSARADVIFFVVSAGTGAGDSWSYLTRLGREVLKRTVFIVWQNDRVSVDETTNAVKRLRQAMLKNLGLACPIFAVSAQDSTAREKLVRWLESEVIFSAPRRARLDELGRLAREALREMTGPPQAAGQVWKRADAQLRRLRQALAESEEQTERQIAGALWKLAQSFDGLRLRGEALLRSQVLLADLWRGRAAWRSGFAREVETQARESLAVQMDDALAGLADDLQRARAEHQRDCRASCGEELPGDPPPFPREEIKATATHLETPLELEPVLAAAAAQAAQLLRLPGLATLGSVAVTLGVLPVAGVLPGTMALTGGTAAFALLLALLLRQQVIAIFGRHFTANRAAFLTAIEEPLRRASGRFYAALARPLEGRLGAHDAERHRHEPLLDRIRQLEATFDRIDEALRAAAVATPTVEAVPTE
jgi:hypothetical protein